MSLKRQLIVVGLVFLVAACALLRLGERTGPTGRWLREAGLEERHATVDGLRLRYVRSGQGPALVLLHGFGSSIYSWNAVFPELARDHDVLALDLPGFGGSDRPEDLTFERVSSGVLGLLDRLAMRRVSLAGSSLGGAVAVTLAARHPALVERLVLIDSAGYNAAATDHPAVVRLIESAPSWLLERLPVERKLVARTLPGVFFDPRKVTSEMIDEYAAPLKRPGTATALRSLLLSTRAVGEGFGAEALRVKSRTLILWGREDPWIPVGHADRFLAAIEGSRAVILKGCGHLPQEERPAETLALIRSFLAVP